MPIVPGNPAATLRGDPSTRIVHYGRIVYGGTFRDEPKWITVCGRGSGIDTVFWDTWPECPTCLWCVAKEFT